MGKWTVNDEQRMTLTLSDLAGAVIEEDFENFKPKSPSDYFCRIFENHYESSNASIGRYLQRLEEQLHNVLGTNATPAVLKALYEHKETELVALKNSVDKGDVEDSIRLQNQTRDLLLDCEDMEGKYYSRTRLYMEAVLEDYFRLTPAQRERIYYAGNFHLIDTAIAERRQLKVTVSSGKTFLVHPYKLMTDKLSNGWYLICYTRRPADPISEKRVSTLRVAHLKSISILKETASIPAHQKQELAKQLHNRGVQFLTAEPVKILVKMSEKGKNKYAGMMTMRPRCRKKNGDIWEFYCTKMQAKRYFCRMAADCQIIEPLDLREETIRYLEAGIKKQKETE